MPGYKMLDTNDTEKLYISEHKESSINPDFGNPFSYEIRNSVVIVHTPIPVSSVPIFLNKLKSVTGDNLDTRHLLLSVVGHGITEQHIVAMHFKPELSEPVVYDSKYSNPRQFFADYPVNTRISDVLSALFNSFIPHRMRTIEKKILETDEPIKINYHNLGTQSLFDGFTCGYHANTHIKILARQIENGVSPTIDSLLEQINNPVEETAQLLSGASKVDVAFTSFIRKAWQDTFMAIESPEEREQKHFAHYFMGWPLPGRGSKLIYFLTLGFITNPLIKTIKLFIELPLNLLSETFSYFKNKLMSWPPKNGLTQSIRSVLLLSMMGFQAGFKGLYYLVRMVTSPITSIKAAWDIHPALGVANILISSILIGGLCVALALFAPPLLAAIAPTTGPIGLGIISSLASPFVSLFSLVGISIPIAPAAVLSLIGVGATVVTLQTLSQIEPYAKRHPARPNVDIMESSDFSEIPRGSNANDLLDAHLSTSFSIVDDVEVEETMANLDERSKSGALFTRSKTSSSENDNTEAKPNAYEPSKPQK